MALQYRKAKMRLTYREGKPEVYKLRKTITQTEETIVNAPYSYQEPESDDEDDGE